MKCLCCLADRPWTEERGCCVRVMDDNSVMVHIMVRSTTWNLRGRAGHIEKNREPARFLMNIKRSGLENNSVVCLSQPTLTQSASGILPLRFPGPRLSSTFRVGAVPPSRLERPTQPILKIPEAATILGSIDFGGAASLSTATCTYLSSL